MCIQPTSAERVLGPAWRAFTIDHSISWIVCLPLPRYPGLIGEHRCFPLPDTTLLEPVLRAHRRAAHALERVGEVARESERPVHAEASWRVDFADHIQQDRLAPLHLRAPHSPPAPPPRHYAHARTRKRTSRRARTHLAPVLREGDEVEPAVVRARLDLPEHAACDSPAPSNVRTLPTALAASARYRDWVRRTAARPRDEVREGPERQPEPADVR
jgi:hypothetical protein